jgi:hypothetical protein
MGITWSKWRQQRGQVVNPKPKVPSEAWFSTCRQIETFDNESSTPKIQSPQEKENLVNHAAKHVESRAASISRSDRSYVQEQPKNSLDGQERPDKVPESLRTGETEGGGDGGSVRSRHAYIAASKPSSKTDLLEGEGNEHETQRNAPGETSSPRFADNNAQFRDGRQENNLSLREQQQQWLQFQDQHSGPQMPSSGNWKKGESIGAGAFGNVFMGLNSETGT